MSPVANHPSASVALSTDPSARRYPAQTISPRTSSSPSAAVRTSTPSSGRPTEPRRKRVGALRVTTPEVSVSPHPSMITMPNPVQKSTTSPGIGAVALPAHTSRSRPARASSGTITCCRAASYAAASAAGGSSPRARCATYARAVPPAASITRRRSSGRLSSAARTDAVSFSHTRGTPKNSAGRSSRARAATVAGSSQRWTCPARRRGR
ncbi:hypothetical protein GCM10010219_39530 [Streptomyces netropsis]|nr:hypothetical protein GCM10010219_39530 [Streptomyces netropsis]